MGAAVTAVGWLGAGLLLAAYALASTARIRAAGSGFQLLNLLGSAALTVNSGYHHAWPSAVLNGAWIAVGAVVLARRSTPLAARRGTPPAARRGTSPAARRGRAGAGTAPGDVG
ncbi:hypothetical protein LN042_15515 [Kitasatospora sp. RB6PN24]|uniref:CBU_0592 family membrane protein n=1 Tax=Kitasatospora humi TaxID=2893891 RepID=UPI001E460865|nr:hypothetical protein [Kitasatospora humi]MCC9308478.1 hypothetical protein [Kitasatospora humi]